MKIFDIFQNICGFFAFPFFYRKIRKQRKDDETIIVLAPKFGDMVYGMIYVGEYKKETGKKIAVFCGETDVKYLKTYGCIDRFITHKKNAYFQTKIFTASFFRFLFLRKCKNKDIIYTAPPQYLYHNRNALDIYANEVFSLKKDVKQLLNLKDVHVESITDFDTKKDKIIVLNSYSNSHKSKCKAVLEQVAQILKKKGYFVYSNVVGNQKPIANTTTLKCPVEELFTICNKIAAFISIRSGIVDFVAGTNSKKVVLYMEKGFLKICSISALNKNIKEFEILNKSDKENFLNYFAINF